jgi:flagellar protein FlgJ
MNVGGTPPLKLDRGPQKPDDDARLRKTASQMEGLFVQKMFAAMRETVNSEDGVLPQSSAEDNFTQLLDEKFSEQVPAQFAGAHSLAQALYNQLRRRLSDADTTTKATTDAAPLSTALHPAAAVPTALRPAAVPASASDKL